MQKWEYHTESSRDMLNFDQLNTLGEQGWDNYAIVGYTYYFKRPLEQKEKEPTQGKHNAAKNKR
jgi:hypothetical protein